MALPETRLAQTGGCRSQQLPRSLPRQPRFGWVLRRWPGRRGEHPWRRPRPPVHGAVSSAERTDEMRSARTRAGRERGRRAAPKKLGRGARRWAITAMTDAEVPRGRRSREDGPRPHVPATQPERHGVHATITRSLGEALPLPGSSVTSSPSGSAASAGFSAMRRALPPASGSTVPSEVHVVPCRAHAW